jgi:UDP-N-acetylglucosamine 2-epimerase
VELGKVMDAEQPARVIVQGDTATAMAGALAAYYRKIPVDHVEAGLRSGNIYHPWPEEVNRKVIGAIASLHFAPTETSAEALKRENVDPARIHVTGNTVIDALHWVTARIEAEPELAGIWPIWKNALRARRSSASPATAARISAAVWKTSPRPSARSPSARMWRSSSRSTPTPMCAR